MARWLDDGLKKPANQDKARPETTTTTTTTKKKKLHNKAAATALEELVVGVVGS